MMNPVSIFSSPRMNGNGKINGSKRNSTSGNGKNPTKSQHNHLNKPQSMDAFFFGNTSTVSEKFLLLSNSVMTLFEFRNEAGEIG